MLSNFGGSNRILAFFIFVAKFALNFFTSAKSVIYMIIVETKGYLDDLRRVMQILYRISFNEVYHRSRERSQNPIQNE